MDCYSPEEGRLAQVLLFILFENDSTFFVGSNDNTCLKSSLSKEIRNFGEFHVEFVKNRRI